jgi:hypothetical protein
MGHVRFLAEAPKEDEVKETDPLKLLSFDEYIRTKRRVNRICYISAIPFVPLGMMGSTNTLILLHPELLNPEMLDPNAFLCVCKSARGLVAVSWRSVQIDR